MDFIHSLLVGDAAYPRKMMIQDLLLIIKQQPKLAKEASSTLIDLGESILVNVSDVELDSLIKGTLVQEPHIRNACLSALQVRFTTY